VTDAPTEAVRPASGADLDRLVGLAVEAVDEQRGARGGGVWSRREARRDPERTLADALGDPATAVVVGTLDDAVVGYGVLRLEPLDDGGLLAVVDDLYVEPPARGVGVGEALMADLVERASAAGCVGIDALALPGNRETKNFFEASGLTARAIVVHRSLEGDRQPAGQE